MFIILLLMLFVFQIYLILGLGKKVQYAFINITIPTVNQKIVGKRINKYIPNLRVNDNTYILAVTAETCPVCKEYLSDLNKIATREEIPLVNLVINYMDRKDPDSNIKIYRDHSVVEKLKIEQFPTYFIIVNHMVVYIALNEVEVGHVLIEYKDKGII